MNSSKKKRAHKKLPRLRSFDEKHSETITVTSAENGFTKASTTKDLFSIR